MIVENQMETKRFMQGFRKKEINEPWRHFHYLTHTDTNNTVVRECWSPWWLEIAA